MGNALRALMSLFGKSDDDVVKDYFKNKVVWITGASAGLGEALALELCRCAHLQGLVISARREPELQRVRKLCMDLSPNFEVSVVPLDLAKLDAVSAAVEEAKKPSGRVDILFNNGGMGCRGLASEISLETDQMLMNVNYFSGVALVKALLPEWMDRGFGHVIQVSSVQGFFSIPGRTAYAASKHASHGFYDCLRAEVAHHGISVTMVAPGYIATSFAANAAEGGGGKYPEGHASGAIPADVLAKQMITATARLKEEIVPAAFNARMARFARCACPGGLFWYMRRRAAKERKKREEPLEDGEYTKLGKDK
jgi:dehydrogenase/reductase SDR family protein 7B